MGLAAVARGAIFMAPGVRFDADQAVVGLMAKHISEGRAFPVYFYGQSYLLAVEAYLAAPVMWLLGPTEVALKLPVLVMNAAAAALLVWRAHRDLGLRPWLALAGALPLVVPPLVPGTRLMEAMGGNVEPLLYTLLLWTLRSRPWLFGLTFAVGLAHREMTIHAALALGLLELAYRGRPSRAMWERWALAALLVATVNGAVTAVRPFGAMFGPGTTARVALNDMSGADAISAQTCLDPARWPERARLLVGEHLPLMAGGFPGPATDIGLSSSIGHGNPGLGPWVLALALAGLGLGWRAARRGVPSEDDSCASAAPASAATGEGLPGTALPWFLIVVGLSSTLAYTFVACSPISAGSLRYNLLVALVPAGALLAGLRFPAPAARAGLVTATVLWAALSLDDYRALAAEVRSGRWPDRRAEAIRALEARQVVALWGEYRLAYILSFRSEERVLVAPATGGRIDDYTRRVAGKAAPFVMQGTCVAGGEELTPGIWLCPAPPPHERPPVY